MKKRFILRAAALLALAGLGGLFSARSVNADFMVTFQEIGSNAGTIAVHDNGSAAGLLDLDSSSGILKLVGTFKSFKIDVVFSQSNAGSAVVPAVLTESIQIQRTGGLATDQLIITVSDNTYTVPHGSPLDLQASGANNTTGTTSHPNGATDVFSASLYGPSVQTVIAPTTLANGQSTGLADYPTASVTSTTFTLKMVNVITMANKSSGAVGNYVGVFQGSMVLDSVNNLDTPVPSSIAMLGSMVVPGLGCFWIRRRRSVVPA